MLKKLCLLLCIALMLPLGACQDANQEDLSLIGEAFFTNLSIHDYGACYEMLNPNRDDIKPSSSPASTPPPDGEKAVQAYTLSEFIDFYDRKIYQSMKVNSLSWQFNQARLIDPTHAELDYTLTYACADIQPFEQSVTLRLARNALNWYVDWSPEAAFQGMAWEDSILISTLKQKRGEILDSEANAYAVNSYGDTVFVRRSKVTDLSDTSTRLAALLQMDAAKIREIILAKKPEVDDYAIIKTYLPNSIDGTLTDLLAAIPAVGIDRTSFSPMRYYPQGPTFAHILGYTHPIEGEIDTERYDVDSRVGADGLEKSYEDMLAGYRGKEIAIIAPDGSKKSTVYRQEAIDGIDLTLTLDYELQTRAENLLERLPQVQATGGAIIALDPRTGDLLAAASYPDYDPNIFSFPIPQAEYDAYIAPEANRPFYDRVTLGTYPPGSTIKPFIAAMALQEGIQNQHFEFTERIDWKTRQWLPTYPDWTYPPITRVSHYEGPVNMENAIVYSDNIYFGYTAMKAGWERIDPFLNTLGFGQDFPFDVRVSKSQIRDTGSTSNLQLMASTGFGQGEMLITPLQMAYIFSAFANEGSIMKPRLVKEYNRMNGMRYETISTVESSVLYKDVLTRETLEILNPMLRKVISSVSGSGYAGRLPDIVTLGKTGTAEIGGNKQREIAWSISFVQSTDYERLVCVVLEVPTEPLDASRYRHTCIKEMLSP